MGWLTDLSNVAVGAIERDRQITKEDLAIRAENLQANKEILLKQKEYKWAKELEDYEAEKLKFDKLEAANAIFKIDKNDINYAMAALPLTTPNWDKLTKKMKETQIFNFDGETFDYTLAGTRDEINKKAALEMTAINDIVAKQIKEAKGDSFLIKKILRKKDSAEKNILENIESKLAAAETVNLTERKVNQENVGLPVKVGGEFSDTSNWKRWMKTNDKWVARFNKLDDSIIFKSIDNEDNWVEIMNVLDLKGLTTEANFETDQRGDTKIVGLSDSSRAFIKTYKAVYNAVKKSISAKELAAAGVDITELADYVNTDYVQNTVYEIIKSREFIIPTPGVKDKDFWAVLPLNIVPLDKENPTNGSVIIPKIVDGKVTNEKVTIVGPNIIFKTLYEDFIKEKFSTIDKSKWKKLKNKELAAYNAIQKDVQTGPLANEFKTYIALNWEEKAKSLKEEINQSESIKRTFKVEIDSKGNAGLNSIKKGFISFDKLKSENKLNAILVAYPWIETTPEYITWLKSQTQ